MSRIDYVGLARQATGAGTKTAVMEYYVPVERSLPSQNREELTIEETIGTRFPTGLEYGTRYFEIPFEGAPRMSSLPRILSAFVGQPATVAGTAAAVGTFTHTHDPAVAGKIPEWHSLFIVRTDPSPAIVDLFWDARGNSLELSVSPNDFVKMNAGFIALDLDDAQSAPTPTTDASARRKFSEVVVELSTDGGTTFTPFASAHWGVTYTNNLDTDEAVLGTRKLYGLPAGNADCEVRFTPRVALNTHYRRALEADPSTLALRMTATGKNILATAVPEKLIVTVHALEVTEAPASVDGGTVLKSVEVTARAKQNETTGKFVTFSVVNAVTSYP